MPSAVLQYPQIGHVPTTSQNPWRPRSLALIVFAWLVLQLGGIFSPGLLDDVDSIYIEIAREMMLRRDFVTPYINGIRFFDKPPLMYWMASASMSVFGIHAWAARLPLALAVLALLLCVYALGNRLFASNPVSDRPGLYAALALVTAIGPYLYTRFFIPDILIALWMTLGVHLFLLALERITSGQPNSSRAALLPCLGFAAVMALNVLTKGLIGAVFPAGFVLLYLAITRQLHLLRRFHLVASTLVFLAIAAPWHVLIALRNPAIALPADLGLPAYGGWAWFYLYNEHIARFLSKRIPHDYGQTPVWLFWLYTALWTMPWTAFVPGAIAAHITTLRTRATAPREREAALSLLLWAGIVVGFFSISARQEYYALPAIPAFCLMAGGLLARADRLPMGHAARSALRASVWLLTPIATIIALICTFFAVFSPHPPPNTTLAELLASDRALYNLSLGHLSDLTGAAMGFFRLPLAGTAIGMLTLGLGSMLLRKAGRTYAANLTLAAGMTVTLLAAHAGLSRFYPILGSKELAQSINAVIQPGDLIVLDGEVTYGSTLIFYTGRQVHVVDGRFNGLWYGSFWPDSPKVFEDEKSLRAMWSQPRRVFLLTYNTAARVQDLSSAGAVHTLAVSGGKSILTNR